MSPSGGRSFLSMLSDSFAPDPDSLPPTSARVSIAPRSEVSSRIRFGARTDVGRRRDHNEDNYLVDEKLSLYVVCDGMGGHASGEVASALAVRAFRDSVLAEKKCLAAYTGAGCAAYGASKQDVVGVLNRAANFASGQVHQQAAADPTKRGMGTTLVAVLLLGNHAFVVHVGDSRAYLLRRGGVEALTRDHNVYNDLIRTKKLELEGMAQQPSAKAITRAIGVYEHCDPETLVLDVAAGDRLLLCTDGLSDYFGGAGAGEEELAGLLSEEDDEAAVTALVDFANESGGRDNITALSVTLGRVGCHDRAELARLDAGRSGLAKSASFGLLGERELYRVLECSDVVAFRPGQVILREGERGEELYWVLSGTVAVHRGDVQVASLRAGEHFGEMSMVRDQPRSARAVAVGDVELLVFSKESFFRLLRTEHEVGVKLLWGFTRVLAERLAATTRELGVERAGEDLSDAVFYDDDDSRPTLRPPPSPF